MALVEPERVCNPLIVLGTHLPRTYQYVSPMENNAEAQGKSTTQDTHGMKGAGYLPEADSV